ncbi:MAG: hypothetical protein RL701_553 [Pseudomonadota bacterium]
MKNVGFRFPSARTRAMALACILGAACLGQSVAQAQPPTTPTPPSLCVDKAKKSAKYTAGVAAGTQRADNFFASAEIARNPVKLRGKLIRALERLYGHVRDAMDEEVGIGRRCRVQGVVDGYLYRITQLLGQCILDGGQWGQFAANLYCDLSVELGGFGENEPFMRPPVGLCGTLFEAVCDGVYAHVATEGSTPLSPAVQSYLSQRGLSVTTYPGCKPYTEGTFQSLYLNAIQIDCSY